MLYDCSESILLPISLFATKTKKDGKQEKTRKNKKKAEKVIHQKLNRKKEKKKRNTFKPIPSYGKALRYPAG